MKTKLLLPCLLFLSLIHGVMTAQEINVKGNNWNIANGSSSPAVYNNTDFEKVLCDGTILNSYIIENTGNSDLILSGPAPNYVTIIGSTDFTVVTQPPSIIPAGTSASFIIQFTGTTVASISTATVSIANNDSNESNYTFVLRGETDEILVTTQSGNLICEGSDTVRAYYLENGVNYYLRDDADDSVIAGPFLGNGVNLAAFNTGQITETTTFNIFAENANGALNFDGTDDHVVIPDTPSLNPTGTISIEAWIKLDAIGQREVIISKPTDDPTNAPFYQYHMEIRPSGELYFAMSLSGFNYELESENFGLIPNTWHHVAVTWDGTRIYLFRDGFRNNGQGFAQGAIASYATDLTIGAQPATNDFGQLTIDEVRIWNIARAQVEIDRFRHRALNGNETGLVGYYNFNEASGTTLTDLTANGNNGTLTNMDAGTDWVDYDNIHCLGELPNKATVEVVPLQDTAAVVLDPILCEEIVSTVEFNTQMGVIYVLRNAVNNAFLGSAFGDGNVQSMEVPFPNAHLPTANNPIEIEITATKLGGGCSAVFTKGTIVRLIKEQGVMVTQLSENPVISLQSSEIGVNYYLRNDVDNSVIHGPMTGTGMALDFPADPTPINGIRVYNVLAEKFSTGIDFDGIDDSVVTPPLDFSAGNTMTIEAWVKPNDITTNQFYEISRQQSGSNLDWLLSFQEFGTVLSFGLNTSNGYNELDIPITASDYTDGNWHHVAAVYDGTNRFVYVDGILIDSDSKTGNVTYTAAQHTIGSSYQITSENFDGAIDDVRFWSMARTQTEIQNNMNLIFSVPETGLVAAYNFDEASGTIARDFVNGNNGTLTNMDPATVWVEGALVTNPLCAFEITDDTYVYQFDTAVISAKVFLQGAYLNPNMGEESLMRDDLRVAGHLPTTSPYSDALTCDASVFNDGGASGTGATADNIVDWIWVELRDTTDNTMVVSGSSALLQRDGDIVGVDGLSDVLFATETGNYHIAVKHRNHLGVMTSLAYSLSHVPSGINFTNAGFPITFGSNAQTTFGMPSNTLGMWAGDANNDGEVIFLNTGAESVDIKQTVLDVSAVESPFGASVFYKPQGYYDTDVNLDGEVIFLNAGNELLLIKDNVLAHPANQIFNSVFYRIQQQLP